MAQCAGKGACILHYLCFYYEHIMNFNPGKFQQILISRTITDELPFLLRLSLKTRRHEHIMRGERACVHVATKNSFQRQNISLQCAAGLFI